MSAGFQCSGFGSGFQRNCGPTTDEHHGGLYLDPPPGWQAIDASPHRRPRGRGPLNPRAVLTSIDFNRDDLDELWLLGLEDLETN